MTEPAPHRSSHLPDRPWHLYVIECKGGRLYTGITVDVDARFKAHRSGKGAKFTKAFPPERMLFSAIFQNRAEASKAEYDFKKLSAGEKRRFIERQIPVRSTTDRKKM